MTVQHKVLALALAALTGCASTPTTQPEPVTRSPAAVGLHPDTAAQLKRRPVFAYRLSDERDEKRRMNMYVSPTNKEAFTLAILLASASGKERTMLPELPQVRTRSWRRDEMPSEKGPLFDSRQVTTAYLLARLESAGLAVPGANACSAAEACGEARFVLEVSEPHEVLTLGGGPPRFAIQTFRSRARILEGAEIRWQHDCQISLSARQAPARDEILEGLQGMLDAAATECGERHSQDLSRQLR